jgi:hypothetical protein
VQLLNVYSINALFTTHLRVHSASKIFEERLVTKGDLTEYPDFEAVFHLVMDAVDNYNEKWEAELRLQQQVRCSARLSF